MKTAPKDRNILLYFEGEDAISIGWWENKSYVPEGNCLTLAGWWNTSNLDGDPDMWRDVPKRPKDVVKE